MFWEKVYLVPSRPIPPPPKSVISRLKRSRNQQRVFPQGGRALQVFPHRSPDAADREGSLAQVVLLKLLPGALMPSLVDGLDHGEAGGELQNILGKALLRDGSSPSIGHLAQSVGVTSSVSSIGSPHDILGAAQLPLGGDHLGEGEHILASVPKEEVPLIPRPIGLS